MVTVSNVIPSVTKDVKELLEAVRVASLSGREPVELVILGICRKNKGGSIKKGKHLWKVVEENSGLFTKKPSATLRVRRCDLILPTSEGNKLLDTLEVNNEIIHPVSLVRKRKEMSAPTLYVLEAYYRDGGEYKRPLTLLFQGKLLFLNHGDVETPPAYATEAVGEIKCLWKQCTDEIPNFQDPKPVATLPHIKYLIRYVMSRFYIDSLSLEDERELECACLLVTKRLFPETEEVKLKLSGEEVSILRIPLAKHDEVCICQKCKSRSCWHVDRLLSSSGRQVGKKPA